MTASPIFIGATFWVANEHAVSRQGAEPYSKVKVHGETRVSWLVGPDYAPTKIPKRDTSYLMNDQERREHEWVLKNAHLIERKIVKQLGYAKLKKIADIVGHPALD